MPSAKQRLLGSLRAGLLIKEYEGRMDAVDRVSEALEQGVITVTEAEELIQWMEVQRG